MATTKSQKAEQQPLAQPGLTERQIQVLRALHILLVEQERFYARLKDIIEQIKATYGDTLTESNVSRILTSIRQFYPDEPEKIIRTFRADSRQAFLLSGAMFVTRKGTARILAELCRTATHTASVPRTEFIARLAKSPALRKAKLDEAKINDLLTWAAAPEVGYLIREGEQIRPAERALRELGYFIAIGLDD